MPFTKEDYEELHEAMVAGMKAGLQDEKGRASVIKEVREFLKENGNFSPSKDPNDLLNELPFNESDSMDSHALN